MFPGWRPRPGEVEMKPHVVRFPARLCSGNPHKLAELRPMLPGFDLQALGQKGFPPEEETSYHENARAKALYGRAVGDPEAWMIGEDSGIEADALGGAPGVRSARFAGHGEDPLDKLLELVGDRRDRTARYVCELVAIAPDGHEVHASGELRGSVALERRGTQGFGYDPIFVPAGERRTVAELGDAWKLLHSHRANAARALNAALATS
jgi:XTP/dITP diphosphohydrolase